jgi:DNA-binding MarR family transcriptional regulator
MLDYDPPHPMNRDPRALHETGLRIYGYLRRNPETTFRQVSVALNLMERTVRNWVREFEKLGYVEVERGRGQGTCSRFRFPLEHSREREDLAS